MRINRDCPKGPLVFQHCCAKQWPLWFCFTHENHTLTAYTVDITGNIVKRHPANYGV